MTLDIASLSDQQLVQLAAIAAGYKIGNVASDGSCILQSDGTSHWRPWSPLKDSLDNYRLSIHCRISIEHAEIAGTNIGSVTARTNSGKRREHGVPYEGDAEAATCRAVLGAAAWLGYEKNNNQLPAERAAAAKPADNPNLVCPLSFVTAAKESAEAKDPTPATSTDAGIANDATPEVSQAASTADSTTTMGV